MTHFDLNLLFYFNNLFSSRYDTVFTDAAESCQISRAEADILVFLASHPTLDTAKEICQNRGFSKAYVSKALDALVKKGFVSLVVDTNDRRCQHIYLSHHSDEIVATLLAAQESVVNTFFHGFSDKQLQDFTDFLKLAANGRRE